MYYNWLPLLELQVTDPGENETVVFLRKYTWGLDLAGQNGTPNSIDAAGGIGGLLACYDTNGTTGGVNPTADDRQYLYLYDAIGNVGQVIDWTNAAVTPPSTAWSAARMVATYEYDPYGNVTASAGAYADDNPFRFSTKYWDDETGSGNWGLRYYSARLGRWVSRDPIEEQGGINIYGYVGNSSVEHVDPQGRQSWTTPYRTAMSCDPLGRRALKADAEAKKARDEQFLQYLRNAEWQFKLAADARTEAAKASAMLSELQNEFGVDDPRLRAVIAYWESQAAQHDEWAGEWRDKAQTMYGGNRLPGVFGSLEAGLLVGYGKVSVACCDECCSQRNMVFEKYCFGGFVGASASTTTLEPFAAGRGFTNVEALQTTVGTYPVMPPAAPFVAAYYRDRSNSRKYLPY